MSTYGIVGRKGSGKTLFLAREGLRAMRDGRRVYSNYGLIGSWHIDNPLDVLGVEEGSLCEIDEAHYYFPARKSFNFPDEMAWFLGQERKIGADLLWSAQYVNAVDKTFRMQSDYIILMRRVCWRFFVCRYYRPTDFDDEGQPKLKAKPYKYKFFVLRRYLTEAYDTKRIIGSNEKLKLARENLESKTWQVRAAEGGGPEKPLSPPRAVSETDLSYSNTLTNR